MELKTLKIDSSLHEKLKELADDKDTSMQNLIENKLSELIAHEEDILFKFNNIEFDKKIEMYNLQLDKTSFKKLINFFEIFLTNRNLKNINEIENLLKLIADLKKEVKTVNKEEVVKETKETKKMSNDDILNAELNDMINKRSQEALKDLYLKTKNDVDIYLDILNEKEKISKEAKEKELVDNVDTNFNYEDIESRYKNTWLNQIVKFENSMEEFKKAELEKAEKQLRIDYPKQICVLNIGDTIRNDKTDLEYEIIKMYNREEGITNLPINDYLPSENEILILKCKSTLLKDTEAAFTYKQIVDIDFKKDGKYLSEIKNEIDIDYEKYISKVTSIKKSASDVKEDIVKFKNSYIEATSAYSTVILNETLINVINENLEKMANIIDNNLEYDEMKNTFMDVKRWFVEAETEYNLNK